VDALKIIQNLSGQRLDPTAVSALMAVFYRGDIQLPKRVVTPVAIPQVPVPSPMPTASDPVTVETTRT